MVSVIPSDTVSINQQLPVLESEPVPLGKAVSEMTDGELIGVLTGGGQWDAQVIEALREGKTRSIPQLVESIFFSLKSDSYLIRIEAVKILAEIGDKRAVPALVALLDDHDSLVRVQVARALGVLADRRSLSYLTTRLLKEDSENVSREIKKTIENITGVPVK